VKKLLEDDMMRLAKENKFNSLEQVRNHFRVVADPFEIGTVLTPTLKLRRPIAKQTYQELITEIYEESEK